MSLPDNVFLLVYLCIIYNSFLHNGINLTDDNDINYHNDRLNAIYKGVIIMAVPMITLVKMITIVQFAERNNLDVFHSSNPSRYYVYRSCDV